VGKAHDLLVDERGYKVSYLVMKKGILRPRLVISRASLLAIDPDRLVIQVALSRDEIRNGPRLVGMRSVRRTRRAYVWPTLGLATGVGGVFTVEDPPLGLLEKGDPHLRSVREVTGYRVIASNGAVGFVEDFAIDHQGWEVRRVAVRDMETTDQPGGRALLLPPLAIAAIEWKERAVYVRLSREEVQKMPESNLSSHSGSGVGLFRHMPPVG
jgi:hypothetical protein